MAGSSYHASVISFKTSETSPAVLKLDIKWGDMSRVLVAVTNQLGYLERILFLERCESHNFVWSGFTNSQLYTVLVWGLKDNTANVTIIDLKDSPATGAVTDLKDNPATGAITDLKDNPATGAVTDPMVASYTVEAFERISIPQSGEPEERVRVLDLAGGNHFGFLTMKDLLKSQEVLEMEVEHKPPLDYSLKPTGPSDSEAGLCVVFCERSQKEYVVMSSAPVSAGIPLLPVCRSRTNYKVRAIGLTNNKGHTFRQLSPVCQQNTPCGSSNIIPIKTYMSKEDLAKLQEKAETYCRNHALTPKKYPITQMYRNKPISYFNGIMYNKNGVMEKYLKDNNGDPYSAINNKISGLFFSGSFDTRETNPPQRPPNFSFFGEIRLFVPAEELFTSDIRMYFADFFCHYKVHYVTVVLTKTGSDDDKFCEERLIELDLQTNPFFTVTENVPHRRNEMPVSPYSDENSVSRDDSHPASEEPSSTETPMARPASPSYTIQEVVQKTFTMTSVNKFHVEFLYTEDVDIKGLTEKCGGDKVYRRTVLVRGNGRSLPEGIPKKASCGTCNLCY